MDWSRRALKESAKEFFLSLGKWGWIVGGFLVLTIITGILPPLGITQIPAWAWIITGFITILLAAFVSFHKVRIERDILIEKAKPKLIVIDTKPSSHSLVWGEYVGLLVFNDGGNRAEDCQGKIELIEFVEDHGSYSLTTRPLNQLLKWRDQVNNQPFSIAGNDKTVLEVIFTKPHLNSAVGCLSYLNPTITDGSITFNDWSALLVIGIRSLNATPLFTICIYELGELGLYWDFKIVESNLDSCPTIEQCREKLKTYKANLALQSPQTSQYGH